jgi:hypothetical protein
MYCPWLLSWYNGEVGNYIWPIKAKQYIVPFRKCLLTYYKTLLVGWRCGSSGKACPANVKPSSNPKPNNKIPLKTKNPTCSYIDQ